MVFFDKYCTEQRFFDPDKLTQFVIFEKNRNKMTEDEMVFGQIFIFKQS